MYKKCTVVILRACMVWHVKVAVLQKSARLLVNCDKCYILYIPRDLTWKENNVDVELLARIGVDSKS